MPSGVPRLGEAVVREKEDRELTAQFPGGEVLGEIKAKGPGVTAWEDPDSKVQIEVEQGPAPWEKIGQDPSDARNFVSCPDDWVLRWINPRLLAQEGWRGWMPVRAQDKRVNVKVPSMVSPEYQIRRGGHDGDILSYMPRHWWETKRKQYYEQVKNSTQASVDRTSGLRERVRSIHPGITVDSYQHPTHTMAEIDKDAP